MRHSKLQNSYERVAVAEDNIREALHHVDAPAALATVICLTSELQTNAKIEQEYLREIKSRKMVFQVTLADAIETRSALRRLPAELKPVDALTLQIRKIIQGLEIDEAARALRAVMNQLVARHDRHLRPI